MQKKILSIELFEEIDLINTNEYDLRLSALSYELIEHITKQDNSLWSYWKSQYLNSLFKYRYVLEKNDNSEFTSIENFDNIYNHCINNYLEDSFIPKGLFVVSLYNFIAVLNETKGLNICELSGELYSNLSYNSIGYYNENSNYLKICSKNINDDFMVKYEITYYHKDLCIEAYTGYNKLNLVPEKFTYNFDDEYYTMDGLTSYDLVLYQGDVYHLDDCVWCIDTERYVYSDDAYYNGDDGEYYEHEHNIEDKTNLRDYHRSEIEDKSNDSIYKIGFEVEKEDSDFKDFSNVRMYGWDAERDGSLNDDGFELVSPIYDLMDMSKFNNDVKNISDFINADYSSNCGGHINVSVKGKNSIEIFDLIRGYLPLIYAMYPNRLDNRYAKAKKVNEFNNEDRYEAINFTKDNILEFRIFSAVRNVNNLKFRYKFVQYMFNNQRKGSASVVRMLLTDSELKKLLLSVYDESKYDNLVERVIKFTDIYMSQRDIKTTTTLIKKMKSGKSTLEQLINN